MPDTLAQRIRAKYPGAYDDLSDSQLESSVKAKYPGVYDDMPATERKPASAEDFMTPEQIANRDMTGWDILKGAGKGLARTASGIVGLAAQSRMIPGLTPDTLPQPVLDSVTPQYTNDAQRLGGTLETVAETALPVIRGGQALASVARSVVPHVIEPVAKAMLSDTSLLTQARQLAAKKILGRVLDASKTPANAGGRLVSGQRVNLEDEIAAALDDLRAPTPPPSVELPPPPNLPPGYVPRASAPPVVSAPAPARGNLVKPAAPRTLESELADMLAQARKAEPPVVITTPPAPELPPGYTPRTSAPAAKAAPKAKPTATHGPRNYFLKQAEAPSAPKREVAPVGLEDLPTSWRSRTTQAGLNIDADVLAAEFGPELTARGVSVMDAVDLVSKNTDLPPDVRAKLVTALMKVKAGAK